MREDNAIIRVVLVDDDVFARLALKDQIDAQPDIRVVGTASNCEEAIDVLRSTNARVVIAEARLPGSGCMDLLDKLRSEGVAVGLLVLTRSERGGDVLRLVQAGATAHLRKSVSSSELAAVRAVATGGRVLDQQAFDAVLRDYRIRCGRRSGGQASTLTPREQQVLTLVAEGCSTREIAARLELSSKTIESHRPRLMEKLGARRMADLVRHALREGLVGVG